MTKEIDWRIIAVGIIALAAIEITALCNGIDGKLLTVIVFIIALAIGITIPSPFKTR